MPKALRSSTPILSVGLRQRNATLPFPIFHLMGQRKGIGIAEAITRVPGSSAWFDRGFVTYSYESKVDMLGVKREDLVDFGAVSEQIAKQMVEGAIAHSRAQVAVAVTGIAGPDGGQPDKPVGTVWFAWKFPKKPIISEVCHFPGDRAAVRRATVAHALAKLLHNLN